MVHFKHDCGHCGGKSCSFHIRDFITNETDCRIIEASVVCAVCDRLSLITYHHFSTNVSFGSYSFDKHYHTLPDEIPEIGFIPAPATSSAPDHTPEPVRSFFLEAVSCVKTAPNASGAMFRKSLDAALKLLHPNGSGNLIKRINSAADEGLLTKDLANWAHRLRIEGNDAVHDEDPFTQEEAEQLYQFAELFMMYVFTLPGMLEAYKQRDADNE
jgi:hypothetical protein